MLKTDFAELARQVADAQPQRRELTLEQEKAVVADRKLLLLAICCLSQWTFEQIVSTYTYTEAEVVKGFARLDRLGIIELRPMNRYRLHVAKTFRWRPHGPVMTYFREQVVDDYYSGGFDGEGEMLMLVHGQIGRSLANTFIERLQRVGAGLRATAPRRPEARARPEALLHAGGRDAQLVVRRVSRLEARRAERRLSSVMSAAGLWLLRPMRSPDAPARIPPADEMHRPLMLWRDEHTQESDPMNQWIKRGFGAWPQWPGLPARPSTPPSTFPTAR